MVSELHEILQRLAGITGAALDLFNLFGSKEEQTNRTQLLSLNCKVFNPGLPIWDHCRWLLAPERAFVFWILNAQRSCGSSSSPCNESTVIKRMLQLQSARLDSENRAAASHQWCLLLINSGFRVSLFLKSYGIISWTCPWNQHVPK